MHYLDFLSKNYFLTWNSFWPRFFLQRFFLITFFPPKYFIWRKTLPNILLPKSTDRLTKLLWWIQLCGFYCILFLFGHKSFWTPGLPEGVLSNRSCPSLRGPLVRPSVFKYLRDRSLVFSNFLHEVRAP